MPRLPELGAAATGFAGYDRATAPYASRNTGPGLWTLEFPYTEVGFFGTSEGISPP